MKIDNITIVGGGSSGWMTAAALNKLVPSIKVTLIESSNIPTIGVGESTLGHINAYMKALGLTDSEWMSKCNATYKTSIKFTDFDRIGNTFHYPFGKFDFTDLDLRDYNEWALVDKDAPKFAEVFNTITHMTNAGKMTNSNELRGYDFDKDTAYHMDAALFGQYLKDTLCQETTHIIDDIVDHKLNSFSHIEYIIGKDSKHYRADLFIDCSGQKSILLGGAMKSEFIPFSDTLLNDSAIATQIPYEDTDTEMTSVTECTGIRSGWVWDIPLWNRIGTGYVYSSKFSSKEEAENEFREHLSKVKGSKRAEDAKVFHIDIKNGIYKEPWTNNVVGIGMSCGFIEPLESTGLMLTHESILALVQTLSMSNNNPNKVARNAYNFSVRETMESFREFISQHFAYSGRTDTPYWQEVTENIDYSKPLSEYKMPSSLRQSLFVDVAYRTHFTQDYDTEMGGCLYILAGSGHNPISILSELNELKLIESKTKYRKHLDKVNNIISTLPSHRQYLSDNIYKDN